MLEILGSGRNIRLGCVFENVLDFLWFSGFRGIYFGENLRLDFLASHFISFFLAIFLNPKSFLNRRF